MQPAWIPPPLPPVPQELEGCQHTLVGDEVVGLKGISGGQRRRVSVGIELVKSPRVLFLDEPTSGGDGQHVGTGGTVHIVVLRTCGHRASVKSPRVLLLDD